VPLATAVGRAEKDGRRPLPAVAAAAPLARGGAAPPARRAAARLTGVAAKHCLDRLRRRRRERRLFETERDEPAAIVEPARSPLAGLLAEEGRDALAAAIATLPER
jgi:DNA-directed RNA polymerase specialized sigma24 family protein